MANPPAAAYGGDDHPVSLDQWHRIVEVGWAPSTPPVSPDVVALVTITGPGGAGASGDPAPGTPTASAKIGSALRYPPSKGAIILRFQAPSADDGSPPTLSWSDLPKFKQGPFWPTGADGKAILGAESFFLTGDVLFANAVAALPAGVSVSGPQGVTVDLTNLDGGTRDGWWGVEFYDYTLGPPGYTDLVQSSSVVQVAPAPAPPLPPPAPGQPPNPPPDPPVDPNTVSFGYTLVIGDGSGGPFPNNNTVTVTGYGPTAPTKEVPSPPAMVFTAHDDGTISVEGGQLLWSFSHSAPDVQIVADPGGGIGSPRPTGTPVILKFNSKGLVS